MSAVFRATASARTLKPSTSASEVLASEISVLLIAPTPEEITLAKVISSGVGAINNTDISLASTSDALVLGFNVRADAVARKTADTEGVRIEYYSIIYNLIDDIKALMSSIRL